MSLYVTRRWIRAAEGGIGEAKAAGNYSAGYFGMAEAREHGCDNVLWLDSKEHRFVEECGTMNMMFVFGDRVATPPLGGTILPGVTRDSAIRLLREQMGREVEERPISIEEVADANAGGTLRECFGVGDRRRGHPGGPPHRRRGGGPAAGGDAGPGRVARPADRHPAGTAPRSLRLGGPAPVATGPF